MQKEHNRRYKDFCKALYDLLYCRTADSRCDCVPEGTIYRFSRVFDISLKIMKDVLTNEMGVTDYGIDSSGAILKTAYSCNITKMIYGFPC